MVTEVVQPKWKARISYLFFTNFPSTKRMPENNNEQFEKGIVIKTRSYLGTQLRIALI